MKKLILILALILFSGDLTAQISSVQTQGSVTNISHTFARRDANGSFWMSDLYVNEATPSLIFQDTDGTDADDNAYWLGGLSDTGTGTEDMDVHLYQQVAGTAVRTFLSDADVGIYLYPLGEASNPVSITTGGDLSGVGKIDITSTKVSGANTANMFRMNLGASETFTGTTGHQFKVYDADATVVHSGGEHAVIYANMKQLSAMTLGGKSVLFSGHNYGSGGSYQVIDAADWRYGNFVDGYKISGGSIVTGIDLSETTVTSEELLGSNSENWENISTDGYWTTDGGIVTGTGLFITGNDAGAIGASGTAFSDMFLASGGVIDFFAGDVTLTHVASNSLVISGGYTQLDRLEIDGASDWIDIATDMFVTSAADIILDPQGLDVKVGDVATDNILPTFSIIGDADSDGAAAVTSETFNIALIANATPTLATWGFTSTQSAGYTFDKAVTVPTLSATTITDGTWTTTAGVQSGLVSLTDGTASWGTSSLTGFVNLALTGHLYLPLLDDATTPTMNFGDDGDGIYSSADGKVDFATNAANRMQLGDGGLTFTDQGSSANSLLLTMVADNTTTPQTGTMGVMFGANPYIRMSPPNAAGAATPTMDMRSDLISWFNGLAGTDYQFSFNGETNDGTITYMEDEDRFDLDNDLLAGGNISAATYGSDGSITDAEFFIHQYFIK